MHKQPVPRWGRSFNQVRSVGLPLAVAFALSATPALAQPKPERRPSAASSSPKPKPTEVQGAVVQIDNEDLVIDLGASSGATSNQLADLFRPLRIKHPVTGKILTDRFKIGQIQFDQVRPTLSLAKPSGTLSRVPAPGDLVIFTLLASTTKAPPPPSSSGVSSTAPNSETSIGSAVSENAETDPNAAANNTAALDLDAKNVTTMFEALRGAPLQLRIARYEAFLRANKDSRFTQVLLEEAAALRAHLRESDQQNRSFRAAEQRPVLVSTAEKWVALSGRPFRMAFEIRGTVRGVVLHVRRKGETLFSPVQMASIGTGFFAATLPAERLTDRDLEYFVEAATDAEALVLLGSPNRPERITVQTSPQNKPLPSGTGSVSILTDFADYNRARGNDYAFQTEGTFAIRYKDLGIRAVRMGFGVYRGVSGTVFELDELKKQGREIGLTYGFVETEIGIHRLFSLTARGAVGLLDDGVSGGAQLFARIGNDRGTNLLLGGEVLGGIGLRSIIELQLNTFPRFPIVLRSEVTNQPAGISVSNENPDPAIATGQSEIAGRGIAQIGFRIFPELVVAVRGSFQGRNINHAGPGIGGSVGYTW